MNLGGTAENDRKDPPSTGNHSNNRNHGELLTQPGPSKGLNPNAESFKAQDVSTPSPSGQTTGRSGNRDGAPRGERQGRGSQRGQQHEAGGRGSRQGGHQHNERRRGGFNQQGAASSAQAEGTSAGRSTSTSAGAGPGAGGSGAPGSKGMNANHLLNFQYESSRSTAPRGGRGRGSAGAGAASGRRYAPQRPQKYDRNKFLQANFRFLVSDAVDIVPFEADADRMFDWDDVVQVEMLTSAPVQCPISLDSPPLCPQITPCGHVFAFPAIMHHLMNHGGEQLRRAAPCPLCFAPLVARELRLVKIRQATPPKVGDVITFTLLKRPHASIIPEPVTRQQQQDKQDKLGSSPGTSAPLLAPQGAASIAAEEGAVVVALKSSEGGGGGGGKKGNHHHHCHHHHGHHHHHHHGNHGHHHDQGGTHHAPCAFELNRFAKFAVTHDPSALWAQAATELANAASQLLAEGGLEAAIEAPYVYAALDALADRARRFAQRRVELAQDRAATGGAMPVPGQAVAIPLPSPSSSASTSAFARGTGGSIAGGGGGGGGELGELPAEMLDPVAAGVAAEAEVKKLFVAAVTGGQANKDSNTTITTAAGSKQLKGSSTSSSSPRAASAAGTSQEPFPTLSAAMTVSMASSTSSAATSSGPFSAKHSNGPASTAAPSAPSTSSLASGTGSSGSGVNGAVQEQNAVAPAGSIAAAAGVAGPPAVAGENAEEAAAGRQEAHERGLSPSLSRAAGGSGAHHDHAFPFQAAFSDDEDELGFGKQLGSSGTAAAAAAASAGVSASSPEAAAVGAAPHMAVGSLDGSAAGLVGIAGGGVEGGRAGGSGSGSGSMPLMGTSPPEHSRLNAPGRAGEHYMYQEAQGTWYFLHPLNLRCLLHHYGSYDKCPAVLQGVVMEMDDMVQCETTRRRWKFLSHLPLTGALKLCEIQMSGLLPPEALAPFAEEISAREKRRKRRAAEERRQAASEAAAARAAAAAKVGPSLQELRAMPQLGTTPSTNGNNGGTDGAASSSAGPLPAAASLALSMNLSPSELETSMALQASLDEALLNAGGIASSPTPAAGVSFAKITRLGFAATGPTLSSAAAGGGSGGLLSSASGSSSSVWGQGIGGGGGGPSVAAPPAPSGAWGARAAAASKAGPSPVTAPALPSGSWGGAAGRNSVASMLKAATGTALPGLGSGTTSSQPISGAASAPGAAAGGGSGDGKKDGKKSGKGVLLFSTGQRKY